MPQPDELDKLVARLPDPESARRFYVELSAMHPAKLRGIKEALLSDLLTLASYSPLLATTVLQNPEYIPWLSRERADTKVRSKEGLLESLSRFSLLHNDVSANVMLARFRRRELLRIYLRDIRRLATISEITEELSNLADAIIEFALRLAQQELENRFGVPLVSDERGRSSPATFCVVALGKLGSKELNYSSDIDLLFIYSHEGSTSDIGTSGSITNREFFIKLAEKVISIAGGASGEGAAYRVDMRLRPHGSIGRLSLSLEETIRYYQSDAREWEQQVLIRSRAIAGEHSIYKDFYSNVESFVYQPDADVAECLENVRLSRRRIEDPIPPGPGYNVKLGRGGIREIEFLAQALQLAHGGRDRWLRFPHTLVSVSRLADRDYITDKQVTVLFDAYEFLRRLEHHLQMEHGLQTHIVPKSEHTRELTAKRMGCSTFEKFEQDLLRHSDGVRDVFESVFEHETDGEAGLDKTADPGARSEIVRSERQCLYDKISAVSPYFAQIFASVPEAVGLPDLSFAESLSSAVTNDKDFGKRLSLLRRIWSRSLLGIVIREIEGDLDMRRSKALQTQLAQASIDTALAVMRDEVAERFGVKDLDLSVLALGKLGGGGVDYGSDLDLVLVYDDQPDLKDISGAELYTRAVEIFVTTLSGMTRDGNLYRVDLRLRPWGKNGASSNPRSFFLNYFENTAAIWELLAFVKLRSVAGRVVSDIEHDVRKIIHQRALAAEPDAMRAETLRIRQLLEREKGGRHRENDLKYGPGGMLDVYFATRYLQLRHNVPDDREDRSTSFTLQLLWENELLTEADRDSFAAGYAFVSELDHNIRLVTGRARRLPASSESVDLIARRMNLADPKALLEQLALHRLGIRRTFEKILLV